MLDVITFGGITNDIFIKTKAAKVISVKEHDYLTEYLAFDYGGKIYLDGILNSPGGGGNNTAVAFARLGLQVAFAGCIGQDEDGRKLMMNLKKEGVRTDFLQRVVDENTGLSVIINSFEGERTAFSFRGANNKLTKDVLDLSALIDTKWFYIPSLTGSSQYLLPELVNLAQENSIKVGCNPGLAQLKMGLSGLKKILSGIEVLVINKEEAELLTGLRAKHRAVDESVCPIEIMKGEPWISDVRMIMRQIYESGVKIIVVTEGIKGAQAYDGQNFYWLPVYPYAPIDTLGAGDSFAASFIAGRILNRQIEDCLKIASANASLVVRQFGAQPGLGKWDDVKTVIEENSQIGVLVEDN
ncbi:MAG TPA: carbohydrate kinase family protein [Candidatus Wirthbacteria bacterium]|nr:carbohydrate kinase family protein [Candidatus Wirthbacteria bacterium]